MTCRSGLFQEEIPDMGISELWQLVSRSYRPRGLPIVMVSVFHLDDFNYFGGLSS
jgi:hypothetical protein